MVGIALRQAQDERSLGFVDGWASPLDRLRTNGPWALWMVGHRHSTSSGRTVLGLCGWLGIAPRQAQDERSLGFVDGWASAFDKLRTNGPWALWMVGHRPSTGSGRTVLGLCGWLGIGIRQAQDERSLGFVDGWASPFDRLRTNGPWALWMVGHRPSTSSGRTVLGLCGWLGIALRQAKDERSLNSVGADRPSTSSGRTVLELSGCGSPFDKLRTNGP